MLISSMTGIKNFVIANYADFDETNCDIENIMVFDNVLLGESPSLNCIVIGFAGLEQAGQSSEFGGYLHHQLITMNAFFLLDGTELERHDIILSGYAFIDSLIEHVMNDSTLDGTVMDASIRHVHSPLTYNRSEMAEYLLLAIEFTIVENLS